MNTQARIDVEDIRDALRASAVLERFAVKGRRAGREFRTKHCPTCGPRARESVGINLDTGRWLCHAHGCAGDVLALLAGYAGIDARRQFRELLELAADIAGVTPTETAPAEREMRRAEMQRRAAERRELEAREARARDESALARATAAWSQLAARSTAGETYLEQRGVAAVRELGLVRFTGTGDVAAALRTVDGAVINVVRRRLANDEPKILGMRACPTMGTFVHAIGDIASGRDVVLVEGLFDALTARLAWPNATILGGHGAGNIAKIAEQAVRRIVLARTRLLLVPHDDEAGSEAMLAAGRLAIAARLFPPHRLRVVDCGAKDLNDAWRAGWRPTTW